jgi:hypothetical protein
MMSSLSLRSTTRQIRSGAILLAVLVCLGIASAITATGIHTSLRARRGMDAQWQLEQTRQLLDAGIRHTYRMTADQAKYEGELLILDNTLDAYPFARIEIKPAVAETTFDGKFRLYDVVATLHNRDATPRQTKRSRMIRVRIFDDPTLTDAIQ